MGNSKFFIFILCLCVSQLIAVPLARAPGKGLLGGKFCSGLDLLDYKTSQEYVYQYETDTMLWINDVSEESKSKMNLKTTVIIKRMGECKFLLRLEDSTLTGDSISESLFPKQHLNDHVAVFEFNSEGEIDSDIMFASSDLPWSRNIKRGIISAFQTKSEKNLRKMDELNDTNEMSMVGYETDVLGRCRTTYELDQDNYVSGKSLRLTKKKSLHACTSSYVYGSLGDLGFYRTQQEFYEAQLHIGKHQCKSYVKDNVLDEVTCQVESTYEQGAKGTKGIQVVVKQTLKLQQVRVGTNKMNYMPEQTETRNIVFEFDDETYMDDSVYENFDVSAYLTRICQKTVSEGLHKEHARDFKILTDFLQLKSTSELISMYDNAKSQCELARITMAEAIVYTNTENSVNAVLNLLEKDAFSDLKWFTKITEYPALTFLARLKNPTEELLNKMSSYLSSKTETFPYLEKMYLIYSTMVSRHCKYNDCSQDDLKRWSSIFAKHLGSNCADSKQRDLVTVALKAIGNIGEFENINTLVQCATTKENTMQMRVSAIESLRKFPYERLNTLEGLTGGILRNTEEDTELRISAFLVLVKGVESEKFEEVATKYMITFMESETDLQLLTFIMDYAKEHGLTALLNPMLSSPKIREQFSVHFKELSWNRYRYRYDLFSDSAIETEATTIFTSNSFIPRSIRFNISGHNFGVSKNYLDATLRIEGVTDYLKGRIIEKLSTQDVLKMIMEKPEKMIEIVQMVASKLQFTAEKPHLSLSVRRHDCEVFYMELNELEDLVKLAEFLRNPRDISLYRKVENLKNIVLSDKRVRQSLVNGFEMVSFLETSASVYSSLDSSKVDTLVKRDFDINNLYSISFSMDRKFQVLFNKDNRLSLKKDMWAVASLKLDMTGYKQNGSISYNLDIAPTARNLLEIDSKYFKMVSGGKYQEVTDFSIEQYKYDRCTPERFRNAVGIDVCVKFNRPILGPILDVIKPVDMDSILADEDIDSDDEDEFTKRPMLPFAGPYHYEVGYKNPENIKTLSLNLNLNSVKAQGAFDFTGTIQTKSQSGSIKNRLEAVYTRKSLDTNLNFDRSMSLEVRVPSTNDVALKVAGDVAYKQKELIEANLMFESKIFKDVLIRSKIMSQKVPTNVISTYILESEVTIDSKEPMGKMVLKLEPTGGDIKSTLSIDVKPNKKDLLKIVDIQGMFTRNKAEKSLKSDISYKVDVKYTNYRKTNAHLHGDFVATLLKSNVDLKLDFESTYFTLSTPANIKFAHSYDGSKATKSFAQLAFKAPSTPLDHGLKLVFEFSDDTKDMKIESLELQIDTPMTPNDRPYTIKYEMDEDSDDNERETTLSVRNFNIDLSKGKTGLAKTLIKVDGDNMLKTFEIKVTRKMGIEKGIDFMIELQKNDKDMALLGLKSVFKTDLTQILTQSGEIPRQEVSIEIDMKILENAGNMKVKLNLEKSESKSMHVLDFEVETKDIIRFLTRVSNLKAKFERKGDTFNGNFEIVRLGDLRSVKMYSTSNSIRKSGDWIENDITYEKEMSNGEKKSARGILKYMLKNYLNFEINIDIDNQMRFNWLAQKQDSLITQKISHASIDDKFESMYMVQVERKKENEIRTMNLNVEAKRGALNTLGDVENVDFLVSAKIKNIRMDPMGWSATILNRNMDARIKIKSLKIDLIGMYARNYDMQTKKTKVISEADFKFPSMLKKDEMAQLKQTFDLTVEEVTLKPCKFCFMNKEFTFNYQLVTDGPLEDKYSLKQINFGLTRDIVDENVNYDLKTVINGESNFNVKMIADLPTGGLKVWKMYVKQNMVKNYYSRILSKTIDVTNCGVETVWDVVNDKAEGKFLFDTSMMCKCDEKVLGDFAISIDRIYPKNLERWTPFSFHTSKIRWSHKRIDGTKILLETTLEKEDMSKKALWDIKMEVQDNKLTTTYSYEREVDPSTKKLIKGNYKSTGTISTSSGNYKENCELYLEDSNDYLNNLKCKMVAITGKEYTLAYDYKSENVKNILGEKSIRLDIILPTTRTVRVDYKRTRENMNENEEIEFEAIAKVYTDFAKSPEKVATFSVKRDKIAPGNTKTSIMFMNSPALTLKQVKFEIERFRKFNETQYKTDLNYELTNGKKNSLKADVMMSSDFNTNSLSEEFSLERPNLNVMYENEFSKKDGKLRHMSIRMGKLLKFEVEKETKENRTICIVFANPDETKYTVESTKSLVDDVYVVNSELKLKNVVMSKMMSSFDAANNVFNVEIMPVKANSNKVYKLNFGMYDEKMATAMVTEEISGSKTIMGTISVKIVKNEMTNKKELIMNMQWNRMWNKIKSDILNDKEESMPTNSQYNSYFGDVYSVLRDDIKPVVDNIRKTRIAMMDELVKSLKLLSDATDFYLPIKYRMSNTMVKIDDNNDDDNNQNDDSSLLTRYNSLQVTLTSLKTMLSPLSKELSKFIPELPAITYNPVQYTKNIKPFANDLQVSRSLVNSHNLYQVSAVYRDSMRSIAESIQNMKNSLLRNMEGVSLRGLINKYKYRSLSSYSLVGHVYNRRNVISFDGEVTVLKSKCRYLLAHEMRKNEFSVILNHNDSPYVISLSAHGSDLIDISYDKVAINNKEINLPYIYSKGKITITRQYNSVCAEVKNDMEICCNKDSKSCSVALTRWYTGKVNGLLGKSNYDRDEVEEDTWYLESSCKLPNIKLKEPVPEAVQTCYSIFGKHRKAIFRDALMVMDSVNDGWKTMCEAVLTANPNGKCELMKAFAYHANRKSMDINVPADCYECTINNKSYKVGEKIPVKTTVTYKDWDSVIILLPCDKNKYPLSDLSSVQKKFKSKYPTNKQYFVRVMEDDASIIQSSTEMANIDIKVIDEMNMNTEMIQNKGLYKALFLAASIFADSGRIANRYVTIVSCGNCLPNTFTGLSLLRLEKMLKQRNIVVSSWGEYQMVDKSSEDDIPIGFSKDHALLYKKSDNSVEIDDASSYEIEYKSDFCSKLSEKTNGGVFNLNLIRKADINFDTISKLIETINPFEVEEGRCEKMDTPFGDFDDITFTKYAKDEKKME